MYRFVLGEVLKPHAVIGTTGRENQLLPRIFTGRRERTGHHQKCGALPDIQPYLQIASYLGSSLLSTLHEKNEGAGKLITQVTSLA